MKRTSNNPHENHSLTILLWIVSLISLIFIVYWRFIFAMEYPRSWDQVDFTLALNRFDLFAMQPHFPGYPYFILGGIWLNKWISNPAQALATWNSLLMILAIYPMYQISRSFLSKTFSIVAVALMQSMVFTNVLTVQPMSEASAVAVLWWYIWSLQQAFKKHSAVWVIISSFIFSLLLGIRLSYLPFGIGLLLLFIHKKKNYSTKQYLSFLILQVLLAAAFQLIWVGGLAVSEGGVAAFLQLALGFSEGHFEEWGGTAVSASTPFFVRLSHLFLNNIVWTGFAGQHLFVLLSLLTLFVYLIIKRMKRRMWNQEVSWFGWTFTIMTISYGLWALFAQNIDKPRHILPLPGMVLFGLLWFGLNKQKNVSKRVIWLLIAVICLQSTYSYITISKANNPAAVYQLIDYLEEKNEPLIVYTWEETRVMSYNRVSFGHEQVFTYSTFLADLNYYDDHRVFLTEQVVEGFDRQGVAIRDQIKPIKSFHSSRLFDPVYHDIELYEFLK
ncbi:glycosyltransferase family 39 protein [Bacillus sp. RAR_GA_16]|uniref:glycosyltransferase family 39 protein n=1 Tax=Bacillus sp. RAR_GA_16 TaxID=2876774 RepID=UPI001CCB7EA6|nr:glycosyltransferase family 39 protein [Bacillus sp. RAR_GA_16]MCA0171657.1 glycosyltransferase family 39 protein [Bacillus sp. RAR_GA_16]